MKNDPKTGNPIIDEAAMKECKQAFLKSYKSGELPSLMKKRLWKTEVTQQKPHKEQKES